MVVEGEELVIEEDSVVVIILLTHQDTEAMLLQLAEDVREELIKNEVIEEERVANIKILFLL